MQPKLEINYKGLYNKATKFIFIIGLLINIILLIGMFTQLKSYGSLDLYFLFLFLACGCGMWILCIVLMFYRSFNFYEDHLIEGLHFQNLIIFKYKLFYDDINRYYIDTSSYKGSERKYIVLLLKRFPYRKKILIRLTVSDGLKILFENQKVEGIIKQLKKPSGKTKLIIFIEKTSEILMILTSLAILILLWFV